MRSPDECLVCRDKVDDGAEGRGKPKGERRQRGGPRGPAALNQLIKFLIPLAGKRIVVMLLLAVARTALSNRLARVQVSTPGTTPLSLNPQSLPAWLRLDPTPSAWRPNPTVPLTQIPALLATVHSFYPSATNHKSIHAPSYNVSKNLQQQGWPANTFNGFQVLEDL